MSSERWGIRREHEIQGMGGKSSGLNFMSKEFPRENRESGIKSGEVEITRRSKAKQKKMSSTGHKKKGKRGPLRLQYGTGGSELVVECGGQLPDKKGFRGGDPGEDGKNLKIGVDGRTSKLKVQEGGGEEV